MCFLNRLRRDNVRKPTLRPISCRRYKDNRGRAVRKRSGVSSSWRTGYAMGHVERPLAEVFSVMPRCAPLRLPQGEASGGPFSRPLPERTLRTQKRVAFALGGKLLPLLYKVPLFYPPDSTRIAPILAVSASRKFRFKFKNSYRRNAAMAQTISFSL